MLHQLNKALLTGQSLCNLQPCFCCSPQPMSSVVKLGDIPFAQLALKFAQGLLGCKLLNIGNGHPMNTQHPNTILLGLRNRHLPHQIR